MRDFGGTGGGRRSQPDLSDLSCLPVSAPRRYGASKKLIDYNFLGIIMKPDVGAISRQENDKGGNNDREILEI
jgi:hypothetical protein